MTSDNSSAETCGCLRYTPLRWTSQPSDSASRSPIMSCNDFSRVVASYLVGRWVSVTPTQLRASSAKPAAAAAANRAVRQRRRLRRQNPLTRASVKLSDTLVRERERETERERESERERKRKSEACGRTATPYWYSAVSCSDNWATCAWMSNTAGQWTATMLQEDQVWATCLPARLVASVPPDRSYPSNINLVVVFRTTSYKDYFHNHIFLTFGQALVATVSQSILSFFHLRFSCLVSYGVLKQQQNLFIFL